MITKLESLAVLAALALVGVLLYAAWSSKGDAASWLVDLFNLGGQYGAPVTASPFGGDPFGAGEGFGGGGGDAF